MSNDRGKCRRPIWVNFALLALLLVASGFTLTGCGLFKLKSPPIQQEKQNWSPAKDGKDDAKKEKADKGKVNDNDKSKTDKKYEADGQDNQDDDDPE
ncbi:MAG TPA: hypothetical protein V6D33_16465 [Cyanophyceae cyanobacterium]